MHRPWSSVSRQSDAIEASAVAIVNSHGAFFPMSAKRDRQDDEKKERHNHSCTRGHEVYFFLNCLIELSIISFFCLKSSLR